MSKSEDYVYVPISYEYMMSHLFGKSNYHGHVGCLTKSSWKNDVRKINKYVKKSIELNVNTDSYHKGRLKYLCDCLEEKVSQSKSLNEINVSFVETYVILLFTLLGNFPDHWNRKAPYADRFWELDGHRSMSYTQTDEQKAALVINLVDTEKAINVEIKEHKNMHEAFGACGSNPAKFIAWLKDKYPRVYCEIF